jgi:hypothetical protein
MERMEREVKVQADGSHQGWASNLFDNMVIDLWWYHMVKMGYAYKHVLLEFFFTSRERCLPPSAALSYFTTASPG